MLGPIKTIITKPKTLTYLKNTTQKVAQNTTKTVKKPNVLDIAMFQQYTFSKQFHLKMDADEIKNLFSFEGDNFFTEVYNFFCKKLRIPEKLKPTIGEYELGNGIGMSYVYTQNIIAKNPNAPIQTKEDIFSLIRHELQHWSQYMDIFRSPKTCQKMINLCTDLSLQQELAGLDHVVKNFSFEQIQTFGVDDDTIKLIQKLKECLAKNDTKSYDELFTAYKKSIKEAYQSQYNNYREQIITELGALDGESKAARRAEKFLDATIAETYYKADGNLHFGKYGFDIREEEAAVAQLTALEDLETTLGKKSCWINNYKKRIQAIEELAKQNSQIKEECAESTQQKGITTAEKAIEFFKYMYD